MGICGVQEVLQVTLPILRVPSVNFLLLGVHHGIPFLEGQGDLISRLMMGELSLLNIGVVGVLSLLNPPSMFAIPN